MASKFQNRLVGTIVLVALGVIVLPGLLDGQKKHYQDEFAAIPLVPKAGDRDEPDMMPAATQALPTQPPEGAAEEVRAGDAAAPSLDPATIAAITPSLNRNLHRSSHRSRNRWSRLSRRLKHHLRRSQNRSRSWKKKQRQRVKPMLCNWAR